MDNQLRRKTIFDILKNSPRAVTGAVLADRCGVSRQIIVGDVALLRAEGCDIISTSRGYRLATKEDKGVQRVLVCRHGMNLLEPELNAIVDNGGIVCNVTVEHEIYGNITGDLDLHSRRDILQYIGRVEAGKAPLLSSMSGGIHSHLIKTKTQEDMEAVEKALRKIGVLYEE